MQKALGSLDSRDSLRSSFAPLTAVLASSPEISDFCLAHESMLS